MDLSVLSLLQPCLTNEASCLYTILNVRLKRSKELVAKCVLILDTKDHNGILGYMYVACERNNFSSREDFIHNKNAC